MAEAKDTGQISEWRSIVTLIVFVITNVIVLFPFHVPVYIPRPVSKAILDTLAASRVISRRHNRIHNAGLEDQKRTHFVKLRLPMNFITAPLIADLFLLAIKAIGRTEVHDGTIGANNISPIDVMLFFITLAYIAISIDASGLIRWLAFKVLQWGGKVGHKLFFYLYAFFFALGSFIGNDPIILSGTAFLAYMTRVSKNINHPKAWIYSQFAVANIASAILVSSNPTNLVLAGAFEIKFIHYTANMIVPVVITAIVLFPFLLYIVFADNNLIPASIEMETLSQEQREKTPVNPNIPYARGIDDQNENLTTDDQRKLLPLEEIMNPFLDKGGAAFGAVIMAATLITLLALNAASTGTGEHPVFWVTLPAAFVMFCWDIAFGWYHREETREIARKGRHQAKQARAERLRLQNGNDEAQNEQEKREKTVPRGDVADAEARTSLQIHQDDISLENLTEDRRRYDSGKPTLALLKAEIAGELETGGCSNSKHLGVDGTRERSQSDSLALSADEQQTRARHELCSISPSKAFPASPSSERPKEQQDLEGAIPAHENRSPTTLVSVVENAYMWLQDTFPTAAAVISHLPFALVPFAFAMFVLVQALVTKGWVQVFAKGWDHWVNKTGTAGSIGGMGFLSVCLCNFAGTNIGTTILLSRVIQEWETLRDGNINDRTFWGTVYSMALGVNYGAFSSAFSASLAGLLWRDILARKHIHVKSVEFARVNFPIIAIAMAVGCTALIAEVYIMRDDKPYNAR
ncbi:putative arsenite efflux transporter ArsB-like protein [Thelonectria olida]|uniref:Arsenite efflux transporter ArsB-like protein n=1 Tax=Thelonectria olida TaxID=1576542 RepID=A0A9P8VZJ4_9HYPO|nr:putative arsenite efflux transporter ArsB-like protein [Thelonectria olida]